MKTTILSASLLLLLSSCTPTKTTNNLNAIDIAGSFEHLTELKVSQLGKNIRYVPLETTDSSLIGNSYNIKLLKDKILVATEGSCLAFDKQTGKYLGTIGHKGGDPEGYSEVVYYIHPQTGILYFIANPINWSNTIKTENSWEKPYNPKVCYKDSVQLLPIHSLSAIMVEESELPHSKAN